MTAYLDVHHAIVSILPLAIFCTTIVMGMFFLGYFFWRGL